MSAAVFIGSTGNTKTRMETAFYSKFHMYRESYFTQFCKFCVKKKLLSPNVTVPTLIRTFKHGVHY